MLDCGGRRLNGKLDMEGPRHKDWDQVERDIERSLFKLIEPAQLQPKRKELSVLLHNIFVNNPDFNYYQGYHDIASVLLILFGSPESAYGPLETLSRHHIRDFLTPNFDPVIHLLQQLYPILLKTDPEVHTHLQEAKIEPFFALGWVITWFGHVIDSVPVVSGIWDFLLVSHPSAIIYVAASVIIERRAQLLKIQPESSAIHTFLSKVPPELPFPAILKRAKQMMQKWPPGDTKSDKIGAITYPQTKIPNYPFPWMTEKPHYWNLLNHPWRVSCTVIVFVSIAGYYYFQHNKP
uniref:Rab-GAP TBC domain-containing protein n=1 Tax=Arcella intermedia TaxID=1963864 RepID=A0A6B2LBQ4_9EUKA